MKIVICKYCKKKTTKHEREGSLFCNRICYMNWKRENPNKKAYKDKVLNSGYYYIYDPNHPNAIGSKKLYIAEHRLIIEKNIKRYLNKNEIVHHINGDRLNNKLSNLIVCTVSKHNSNNANKKKRDRNGQFTI